MALFLLRDPKCVFIHIHKTAGSSIRKGVWGGKFQGRSFGKMPKEWEKFFSFAFVRDPIDRFLSTYRMFTQGTYETSDALHKRGTRDVTIDEFIQISLDESIIYDERRKTFEERVRHHVIPQTHPFYCLNKAQFVGRFWHLETDFARIAAHLGVVSELPRLNYTKSQQVITLSASQRAALMDFYADDYAFIENQLPTYNRLS